MGNSLIIIDPGHGGRDNGAASSKYKEKNIALEISKYQYKRFNELGIKTEMTRYKDKYLSSKERTQIVRESGAKYCISNHINAGGGEGAEVIHSVFEDGELASLVLDEIKKVGQKTRRIFSRNLPGVEVPRDYYFIHRETGSVRTLIIEYCFIDNREDLKRFLNMFNDILEAVIKAFCSFLDYSYIRRKN